MVRPAVNEEGSIELKARIRVKRDGQDLGQPLEVPLETSQVGSDIHMYGNSIGLNGFPELGPYEVIFEIVETNSDTLVEHALVIELIE